MTGAFLYLAWCSVRNRLARQARRLRTPRYIVALLLGLLYLYAIAEQQRAARGGADPSAGQWVQLIALLGVVAAVIWAWIFGSERRALLFSPADVTFLFAGPLTRRSLIQYKLLRAQVPVLLNVLLWTLLLSREEFGVSTWLRALSLWVLVTTVAFHRLGASFVRSAVREHRGSGLRRRAISVTAAIAGAFVLGWTAWRAAPHLLGAARSQGTDAAFEALSALISRAPLRWLLVPFNAMVRPLTAPDFAAWLHAIWPASALLVLHYIWVVRSDADFEESALEYTLARARGDSRNQNRGLPVRPRRPLPPILRLSPLGWPAGAILWKNLVAVIRVRPVRGALMAGIAAGLACALLSFGGKTSLAEVVGWLALMWAVVMLLIGPQWIRNDLRSDLAHFDLLRSYPLAGRSVIAAETIGSAAVLTIMQLALLVLAYLAFLGNHDMELTLRERTLGLVAAVVYLPLISFLSMLVQNAGAILYPAWIRSGPDRAAGVEALGQNMLLIVAHFGILTVLLSVPVVAGTAIQVILVRGLGVWAEIPRAAVIFAFVAFEVKVLLAWLGGVLERTDPAAVGV